MPARILACLAEWCLGKGSRVVYLLGPLWGIGLGFFQDGRTASGCELGGLTLRGWFWSLLLWQVARGCGESRLLDRRTHRKTPRVRWQGAPILAVQRVALGFLPTEPGQLPAFFSLRRAKKEVVFCFRPVVRGQGSGPQRPPRRADIHLAKGFLALKFVAFASGFCFVV